MYILFMCLEKKHGSDNMLFSTPSAAFLLKCHKSKKAIEVKDLAMNIDEYTNMLQTETWRWSIFY